MIAVAVGVMVALFIGIILGALCGIKYMQKKLKKINSKRCIHTPEENVMRPINKGPVYEEVKLEDKTTTIDLSQNIAYEQVKMSS